MNEKLLQKLPEDFNDYKTIIEKSIKKVLNLKYEENEEIHLWNSKIGGFPYLTEVADYPVDENNDHLGFLAQINFEELPQLNDYPKKGILQFFIKQDIEYFGMDEDDPIIQKNFKVKFIENISKDNLITDFSFLNINFDILPISNKEVMISFEENTELMPTNESYFITKKLHTDGNFLGCSDFFKQDALQQKYQEIVDKTLNNSKVGGYPCFLNVNPREQVKEYHKFDTVLFQIASTGKHNIVWADYGTAKFLIAKEDLINKNFDNIFYYWDY